MEERRRQPRMRTYKTGQIAFAGRRCVFSCTIRNLSSDGAMLQVGAPIGVPETFDLIFDADRSVHHCHVVWQTETRIGVRF